MSMLGGIKDCVPPYIAIQGAGGGGILTLTQIIVADLVPLRERPKFTGLLAVVRTAFLMSVSSDTVLNVRW